MKIMLLLVIDNVTFKNEDNTASNEADATASHDENCYC